MQEKILKKIISATTGQGSEKLIDVLYKKQNINEFLIAKKLGMTINQTRNILYKLADDGLVTFIRKKDKKKGGWYTYFWTLKIKRSMEKLSEELNMKIEELEKQLKLRETERHFYCENCDIEYKEEDAMLLEYTCSECGEVLEIRDSGDITARIKSDIKKLASELSIVNEEISMIELKEVKARERKIKAELRKKEEERRKKRKQKEKEKRLAASVKLGAQKKVEKKSGVRKKSGKSTHRQRAVKKTKKKIKRKPSKGKKR